MQAEMGSVVLCVLVNSGDDRPAQASMRMFSRAAGFGDGCLLPHNTHVM
jgi:hypothetical protein